MSAGAHDTPPGSSANSIFDHSSDDHESHRDWESEKTKPLYMTFWARPHMRQYFHKGLLWRSNALQETASYELFVDLFYVGIIAITGDVAAEEATGHSLLRFVITFIMSWKFWSDIMVFVGWFEGDDILRRLSVLFLLVCLLGLTTNMAESWDHTYTPLVSFYIAARWFNGLYLCWMAYLIPMVRAAMISQALCMFIPGLLWIGSIHVEEPGRQGLIWTALILDLFGNVGIVILRRSAELFSTRITEWAARYGDCSYI